MALPPFGLKNSILIVNDVFETVKSGGIAVQDSDCAQEAMLFFSGLF
jgi:hypothetical protein